MLQILALAPVGKGITISGCEKPNDPYVVLYSPREGLFHIELLSRLLKINMDPIFDNRLQFSDYAIIGMESTFALAVAHIETIKEFVRNTNKPPINAEEE